MTINQSRFKKHLTATLALLACIAVLVVLPSRATAENTAPLPPSVQKAAPPSHSVQKKLTKQTAEALNRVPNVHVHPKQLEPVQLPPIKGFHPIKKILRPVEQLEAQSIQLQQQVMRLEGPIAALQPSMLGLEKKMVVVNRQVGSMQSQVAAMQSQLRSVESQVNGARTEIAGIKGELRGIRRPIESLRGPIGQVAQPLTGVQTQLGFILLAIMVAAVMIAIGTPVAAILIYMNRHKLFPGQAKDLPQVTVKPSRPVRA